jgi:hypothetical protein
MFRCFLGSKLKGEAKTFKTKEGLIAKTQGRNSQQEQASSKPRTRSKSLQNYSDETSTLLNSTFLYLHLSSYCLLISLLLAFCCFSCDIFLPTMIYYLSIYLSILSAILSNDFLDSNLAY